MDTHRLGGDWQLLRNTIEQYRRNCRDTGVGRPPDLTAIISLPRFREKKRGPGTAAAMLAWFEEYFIEQEPGVYRVQMIPSDPQGWRSSMGFADDHRFYKIEILDDSAPISSLTKQLIVEREEGEMTRDVYILRNEELYVVGNMDVHASALDFVDAAYAVVQPPAHFPKWTVTDVSKETLPESLLPPSIWREPIFTSIRLQSAYPKAHDLLSAWLDRNRVVNKETTMTKERTPVGEETKTLKETVTEQHKALGKVALMGLAMGGMDVAGNKTLDFARVKLAKHVPGVDWDAMLASPLGREIVKAAFAYAAHTVATHAPNQVPKAELVKQVAEMQMQLSVMKASAPIMNDLLELFIEFGKIGETIPEEAFKSLAGGDSSTVADEVASIPAATRIGVAR